jgi:hypothetical protein
VKLLAGVRDMALEEAVFEMTFLCETPKDEDVPARVLLEFSYKYEST